MAHEIWGNRFASRNKPAWHGLGTQFDTPLTATEAARLARIDYTVEKLPMQVPTPDGSVIAVPDQFAIVRMQQGDDGYRVFGVVGEDYEVLNNTQIAEVLDPLTEQFPVETCGALGAGERSFFSLKASQSSEIGGDEITNYFVVSDGKDGLRKLRILYTPVRVVCQNTLTAATAQASVNIEIDHRQDTVADLAFYSRLTLEFLAAQEKTLECFRRMTRRHYTADERVRIMQAAFRPPTIPQRMILADTYEIARLAEAGVPGADLQWQKAKASERSWRLAQERMTLCHQLASEALRKFNDEFPATAGTMWALYNACTETSDWRKGRGAVAESVLFGDRAQEKARAFGAIMDLCN
jgi:phage/plasmid-like protein (TIGR03299 family)